MPLEAAPLTLESQLCFALYSTLHAVSRVYGELLPELGVTYPQYLVMLVLWQEDDIGVKALGDRLHLDSGTLTPLLKRLELGGLIDRKRDGRDERKVRITLTAQGRALRRQAGCVPRRVGEAMGRAPEDLAALRDDLLRLRATLLGQHGGTEEPGPSGHRRGKRSLITGGPKRVRKSGWQSREPAILRSETNGS